MTKTVKVNATLPNGNTLSTRMVRTDLEPLTMAYFPSGSEVVYYINKVTKDFVRFMTGKGYSVIDPAYLSRTVLAEAEYYV